MEKGRGEVGITKLAAVVEAKPPLTSDSSTAPNPPPATAKGLLVASKSGKKYHLPTCPGAKQISEQNKIWFASYEAAQKAGYTAAANCPGLK